MLVREGVAESVTENRASVTCMCAERSERKETDNHTGCTHARTHAHAHANTQRAHSYR